MRKVLCYYLYFDNPKEGYIGLSSNFKNRIRQHKNDRNYKNAKARWFRENLKMGKTLNYKILREGLTREDAISLENQLIRRYRKQGYTLFNTALGSTNSSYIPVNNQNKLSKEYAIIKDAKVFYVKGLLTFCKDNGLSHGNLHSCLKGKIRHAQGYIVYFRDDWDNLDWLDKETILDSYWATISEIRLDNSHPKKCIVTDVFSNTSYNFDTTQEAIKFMDCSVGIVYEYLKGRRKSYIKSKYKIAYVNEIQAA